MTTGAIKSPKFVLYFPRKDYFVDASLFEFVRFYMILHKRYYKVYVKSLNLDKDRREAISNTLMCFEAHTKIPDIPDDDTPLRAIIIKQT